jgi:hypothetical protein
VRWTLVQYGNLNTCIIIWVEKKSAAPPSPAQLLLFSEGFSMAKGRRGLDRRHRDKGGRIEKKHGSTRIGSLRKEYGERFARGRRKDMMLKTLLKETGFPSLHEYLKRRHK